MLKDVPAESCISVNFQSSIYSSFQSFSDVSGTFWKRFVQDDYEEKWSEKYLQQAASLQGGSEEKDDDDGKEKETPMNPMMAMMMNPMMMGMMMNPMMAGMNPMTFGRQESATTHLNSFEETEETVEHFVDQRLIPDGVLLTCRL